MIKYRVDQRAGHVRVETDDPNVLAICRPGTGGVTLDESTLRMMLADLEQQPTLAELAGEA